MTRYHFDVEDGDTHPDPIGDVFTDLESVRCEALRRTVELLATTYDKLWCGQPWKMTVSDDRGRVQFTLNFLAVNAPLTECYGKRVAEF